MNPAESQLDGKCRDCAFTITGNPVFNGPVSIHFNYNCGKPLLSDPYYEQPSGDDNFDDLMVLSTTEEIYSQHLGDKGMYQIKSSPKGRALIINNEFKDNPGERKGSSIDFMKMMQLWDQMGCAVEMEKNLTGAHIKKRVAKFSNSDRVEDTDFCVVFIMSHGAEDDFIIGEKKTKTSVEALVDIMKSSKKLLGKPKLLFFQMCRGSKGEKQSQIDAGGFDTSDSTWFIGLLHDLLPQGSPVEAECTSVDMTEDHCDRTAEEHLDGSRDMMIGFATKPDHVSFRTPKGSWFVSAIADVFANHAKDKDLKTLMKMVRDRVRENKSDMPSDKRYNNCTATVEAYDTFMGKKLFLFPGYPENF